MAMPLLVLLLGTLALVADAKHIAVLGGMMKSHHLTVVPLIEELVARGHEVSFLLPNTTEYRTFFASGVSSARMEYLGTQEWSFNSLFTGPEYDFKNLPWYKKPIVFVKILLSYREALDAPLFSMHDELVQWLNTTKVDAILMHTASFGSKPAVSDSGVPWISYFSVPPLPLFLVHDRDKVCRYPNYLRPPSVAQLKASLATRVKNHMICRFLQLYMFFADNEFKALFEARGLDMGANTFMQSLIDAPGIMLLGGPPLSLNVALPSNVHVLGMIQRHASREIPADMLSWLDAAAEAEAPVVYISMGTKYELHEGTCTQLVSHLKQLSRALGIRFLWSLRASQQETLSAFLPEQGESMRIEFFTPQPEVLQHPSVRVFLSHCGWGGVTDSVNAGVPVLGYPGMQDQFINARMLAEAGAGIIIADDFSNLVESVELMLKDAAFASASRAAGDTLKSYGGLSRAIEIVEAAAEGKYLKPDPETFAKVTDVDPFFDEPQPVEQWIGVIIVGVFIFILLRLIVSICYVCCRCAWRRVCRSQGKTNDDKKER